MAKKKNNLEVVERKTTVEIPEKRPGCTVGLKPLLLTIFWCALCGIAVKECKRADIRLQEEKIKLEQLKDSTTIKPDTLKILSFQKEYIPLLRQLQKTK